MPFYLKDRDISSDIAAIRSALIVPCRFCPAASLAVREKSPYIELFSQVLENAFVRIVHSGVEVPPGRQRNQNRCIR
jgi:hypothetical protein